MKRVLRGERKRKEEGRDRRRLREANANRSVVESLRLRATDAELIKNRRSSLSRGTILGETQRHCLFVSCTLPLPHKKKKKTDKTTTTTEQKRQEDVGQRHQGRRQQKQFLCSQEDNKGGEERIEGKSSGETVLNVSWRPELVIYSVFFLPTCTQMSTTPENYVDVQILPSVQEAVDSVVHPLSSIISRCD